MYFYYLFQSFPDVIINVCNFVNIIGIHIIMVLLYVSIFPYSRQHSTHYIKYHTNYFRLLVFLYLFIINKYWLPVSLEWEHVYQPNKNKIKSRNISLCTMPIDINLNILEYKKEDTSQNMYRNLFHNTIQTYHNYKHI